MFTKATKTQSRLRLALMGPSGSGKTFTALMFAQALGQRIAVIDTEYGSSQIYADRFSFDVAVLKQHHPRQYINAIAAADEAGYDVLIIDSLSHAWMGREGALELKDQAAKRGGMNDYTAWSVVTPLHNQLLDAIKGATCHVIATLRTKTAYEVERDERGKTIIRKLGLAPVQRDGVEYEFDIIGDLTIDHTLLITKSRMDTLSGRIIERPDGTVADEMAAWLRDGAPLPARFDRGQLVGRIQRLTEQAQRLGIFVALPDLETADEMTLVRTGKDLRAQVAAAHEAEAALDGDDAQDAEADAA